MTRTATASAPANFALAKYWGKSDEEARHPAVPSVSACIRGLTATATATFSDDFNDDTATLNGDPIDASTRDRLDVVLDAVRDLAGLRARAHIESSTNFPVKAGLASSAAGLAAVTAAAWKAAGLDATDLDAIADVARMGSGSACRSVHGGFVAWSPTPDGGSEVRHVAAAAHWPLEMCLVRVHSGPKAIGSTDGMRRAMESPVWQAWVDTAKTDAATIEDAIRLRDFDTLGATAEANCLLMHATTMTARPAYFYFRAETFAVIDAVQRLRDGGLRAFFTIDAGPNVKVFAEPGQGDAVADALRNELKKVAGGADLAVDRYDVGDGVVFED